MYEGDIVRLRALRSEDADMFARWMSNRDNMLMALGGGSMPVTAESERDWISKNSQNAFAIETLAESRLVGVCSYFAVNDQAAKCKVGLFIGDSADRGKGWGGDALKTLLKFLFIDKNMHRVGLDVSSYNERAIGLYEKLGFVREVVYREQVYAMGKYWDKYAYSMLKDEYVRKYGN